MMEDNGARVSSDESAAADASQPRQRKRRKWDQPAEALVSAGIALPLGNAGALGAISGAFVTNPLAVGSTPISPMLQQHAAAVVPKLNQHKIQDELIIAREIVINDAESSVRYKLTKRQTQEEIQRCTGAVVITRGKYRPPNAPADGDKPLYLHISAAAHLKETAERILAVDRAAAMVEEMLKQGQDSPAVSSTFMTATSNSVKALSTCVHLGFDADPSWNIAARIRGPNDQYINHIMNETGTTVILRGCGSGNLESLYTEVTEAQQPLHLFLSSNNPKSLEDAKRLAENLLDTISVEFGASRASLCKVYGAVPPPQNLLNGVQTSGNEQKMDPSPPAGLASTVVTAPACPVTVPGFTSVYSQGPVLPPGGLSNSGQPQVNAIGYPRPVLSGGTSYTGYEGIYPQATPLQQVALALRQSPYITATVTPTTATSNTVASMISFSSTASNSSLISASDSENEKKPPQKRKFQELPVGSKGATNSNQGPEILKQSEPSVNGVKNVANMPAPKKMVQSLSDGMPPLPPRIMPPPPSRTQSPPPPKFNSSTAGNLHEKSSVANKVKSDSVPDTLVKLMEYGDDDEEYEFEETRDELFNKNSNAIKVQKPFWAL
ncbi:hypothetical protein SLE2022_191070 [Rubroshorea leprosula]